MTVDVVTEIEIGRPRAQVSAYASDPDNATAWYENIEAVDWQSPKPVAVGSRLAFVAQLPRSASRPTPTRSRTSIPASAS